MFILSIVPLPLTPDTGNVNPTQRLAEIRGKIAAAERRIRDLEALLTELILLERAITPVDGIANPQDANSVRHELYKARAFEGELRTAEQFWQQIVESNKQAEKDTHDLAKRA